MSRGQKPRNPRYFPKMKVRGARRKRLAPFQWTAGSFDRLTVTAEFATRSFHVLSDLLSRGDERR